MAATGYLLHLKTGELFGYTEQWANMTDTFIPYDPDVHGIREEVAHVLGLRNPKAAIPRKAEPRVSRLVIEDDEPAQ